MSLAAMMAQGSRFANRHDLATGAFTVPGGVTTIWLVVAAQGGAAGPDNIGGTPGGGGGGGGAILFVPYTVAPGQQYERISQTENTFPMQSTRWIVRLASSPFTALCQVVSGQPANNSGDNRGGAGGRVELGSQYSFDALDGGLAGGFSSGDGGAGSSGVYGGGLAISGGGGGGGGLFSPVTLGGDGAAGGSYAGHIADLVYGGNGGGFMPGSRRLDASTVTDPGVNRFEVYY